MLQIILENIVIHFTNIILLSVMHNGLHMFHLISAYGYKLGKDN